MVARILQIFRHKRLVVGAVVLIGTVGWRFAAAPVEINAAVWKEITQPPPLGSSPPLNTSESFQTKAGSQTTGSLTLGGGLTISDSDPASHPDLVVGTMTNTRKICWNNDCKNSWDHVAGISERYVKVQSDPNQTESGWVSVKGLDADPANPLRQTSALKFKTTVQTSNAAVWGVDSSAGLDLSAGVYARAGANSTNNIALYGKANASILAWAGYFSGNVAVERPFDFFVGGTRVEGGNHDVGELCINDVCQSSWPEPTAGDLHWLDSSGTLQPKNTTLNLAVGGSDANAPFYLQNIPAQSEVQLKIKGTGTAATRPGTEVTIR